MALTGQQREKLRILGEICRERDIIDTLLSKLDSGKDINYLEQAVDLTVSEITDIQSDIQARISTIKTKVQSL